MIIRILNRPDTEERLGPKRACAQGWITQGANENWYNYLYNNCLRNRTSACNLRRMVADSSRVICNFAILYTTNFPIREWGCPGNNFLWTGSCRVHIML